MSKNSRRRQKADRQMRVWQCLDPVSNVVLVTLVLYSDGGSEVTVNANITGPQKEMSAYQLGDEFPNWTHDARHKFLFDRHQS